MEQTAANKTGTSDASGELEILSPEYIPEKHASYVNWLMRAVNTKDCTNIALAGPYGCGKSSILKGFEREYSSNRAGCECLFIRLSTLARRKTFKGKKAKSGKADSTGVSPTVEIEREIVRQLLYTGNPGKVPKSRFNQIHPISVRDRVFESVLLTVAVLIVLGMVLLAASSADRGLGAWLERSPGWLAPVALSISGVLLFLAIYYYFPRLRGRFRVGTVSAGGASLTLAEGASSYFDEYLDEIVYFFEANNYDTVVFEDLDRFDDPGIFDRLKELNILLNSSFAVKSCEGRDQVNFIYAVRDSVFELLDVGASERGAGDGFWGGSVRGSGRVKFFDEVISVMPFISSQNAYPVAKKLFKEIRLTPPCVSGADSDQSDASESSWSDFDECLHVAAPHIADMRLIKNIRNEYTIMLETMGPADLAKGLGLSYSGLLAMAIYKNVYPGDFERINEGRSWLNEIQRAHADAVERRVERLRARLSFGGEDPASRTEVASLFEELSRSLESKLDEVYPSAWRALEAADLVYPRGQTGSPELWQSLASDAARAEIKVVLDTASVPFSREHFVKIFVPDLEGTGLLPPEYGSESDPEARKLNSQIDDLLVCDFADYPDLLCEAEGHDAEIPFRELVRETAPGKLAFDLVSSGYLRRNFPLYSSLRPDGESPTAFSFLVDHVRADTPDCYFRLNDEDCACLLELLSPGQLRKRGSFNISFLDYLLRNRKWYAGIMISGACECFADGAGATSGVGAGRQLLCGFIEENLDYPEKWRNDAVLGRMASSLPSVFDIILENQSLSDVRKGEAIALALTYSSSDVQYDLNCLGDWIDGHSGDLRFDQVDFGGDSASAAGKILEGCGYECPDLQSCSESLRYELISRGLYVLTAANIKTALDVKSLPPLEDLRRHSDRIERRQLCLRMMGDPNLLANYVRGLEDGECSLREYDSDVLIDIAQALRKQDVGEIESFLSDLVDKADSSYFVEDIRALLGFCRLKRGSGESEALVTLISYFILRGLVAVNEDNVLGVVEMIGDDGIPLDSNCLPLLLSHGKSSSLSVRRKDIHDSAQMLIQSKELGDGTVLKAISSLDALEPNTIANMDLMSLWERSGRGAEGLRQLQAVLEKTANSGNLMSKPLLQETIDNNQKFDIALDSTTWESNQHMKPSINEGAINIKKPDEKNDAGGDDDGRNG